jgi:hypothetical protein
MPEHAIKNVKSSGRKNILGFLLEQTNDPNFSEVIRFDPRETGL